MTKLFQLKIKSKQGVSSLSNTKANAQHAYKYSFVLDCHTNIHKCICISSKIVAGTQKYTKTQSSNSIHHHGAYNN